MVSSWKNSAMSFINKKWYPGEPTTLPGDEHLRSIPVNRDLAMMTTDDWGLQAVADMPNTSSVVEYKHSPAHTFVYLCEAVFIPMLLMSAILTNIACLIVLPKTRMATTFKTCLMALSCSDLLWGIVGFSNMMVEVVVYKGEVPYGVWQTMAVVAYSTFYITIYFMCNSAATVIAIVIFRRITISHPLIARGYLTRSRVLLVCLGIYMVNLILVMPTSLSVLWQSCHKDNHTQICLRLEKKIGMQNLQKITYYLYALTVLYGPILVVVYVVSLINIKISLKRSNQFAESRGANEGTRRRIQKTAKITRILLLILILDTICTLPVCIQGFALMMDPKDTVFTDDKTGYKVFDVIVEIFLNCRPTYNFWLYVFTHKEFKRRAKDIFCTNRILACCGLQNNSPPENLNFSLGSSLVEDSTVSTSRSQNGRKKRNTFEQSSYA